MRIVGIVTKGNVCTVEVCEIVEVFLLKESLSSSQDSPLLFLHVSVIPRCRIWSIISLVRESCQSHDKRGTTSGNYEVSCNKDAEFELRQGFKQEYSSLTNYVRRSDILETKSVAGGSSSSGLDEKLSGKVE